MDPKDKVYAVLGLVAELDASKISPNYALSQAAIYEDAFLQCMDLCGHSGLLSYSSVTARLAGAPSWVPNWDFDYTPVCDGNTVDLASCQAYATYNETDNLDVLVVSWRYVETASEPLPSIAREFGNTIRKAYLNLSLDSARKDSTLDTILRTLATGHLVDRWPEAEASYSSLSLLKGCVLREQRHSNPEWLAIRSGASLANVEEQKRPHWPRPYFR